MTGRRWDPLIDLLTLQERVNRLFSESLNLLDRSVTGSGATVLADVYETPGAYVVEVELPGLSQDEVEVSVDGDSLTLRGERRGGEARPESFLRAERSYGPFTRVFRFAQEVDPEGLSACFEDGLLRLELPKAGVRAGRSGRRGH